MISGEFNLAYWDVLLFFLQEKIPISYNEFMSHSPIRKPHNNPGQSTQRILLKKLGVYLLILFGIGWVYMFFLGWLLSHWFPFQLRLALIISVVLFPLVLISIRILNRRVDALDSFILGRDGEQGMGLYLNRLWSDTNFVFHDIQCKWQNGRPFNIDHLIVSTKGVFAIETKTVSKRDHFHNTIKHRGNQIWINNIPEKFGHFDEATSHAKWLKKHLASKGLHEIPVIPVLLYPSWDVDSKWDRDNPDILVFSGRAFNSEFNNMPDRVPLAYFERVKQCVCELARNSED